MLLFLLLVQSKLHRVIAFSESSVQNPLLMVRKILFFHKIINDISHFYFVMYYILRWRTLSNRINKSKEASTSFYGNSNIWVIILSLLFLNNEIISVTNFRKLNQHFSLKLKFSVSWYPKKTHFLWFLTQTKSSY